MYESTCCHLNACRCCRTKFGQWQKCFDQMEAVQFEFEIAAETKKSLTEFLAEVVEKLEGMKTFKKTYMKFTIGVESYLKKDTPPDTCRCASAYVYVCVCYVLDAHVRCISMCLGHMYG